MTNGDNNLGELIEEANSEVEIGLETAMAAKPKRQRKASEVFRPFFAAILFIAALLIYLENQPEETRPAVTAAELTNLVRQARDSVEAATVNGELPPVLPNAALGAIVRYASYGSGYFLSTQLNGVLVEMDETGKVTVSGLEDAR